jgi:hypothetical protein
VRRKTPGRLAGGKIIFRPAMRNNISLSGLDFFNSILNGR